MADVMIGVLLDDDEMVVDVVVLVAAGTDRKDRSNDGLLLMGAGVDVAVVACGAGTTREAQVTVCVGTGGEEEAPLAQRRDRSRELLDVGCLEVLFVRFVLLALETAVGPEKSGNRTSPTVPSDELVNTDCQELLPEDVSGWHVWLVTVGRSLSASLLCPSWYLRVLVISDDAPWSLLCAASCSAEFVM